MEKDSSNNPIPLIGIWKLISFEARRQGEEPSFPFREDAKGMLIYTHVGRFSVQMIGVNRPEFASADQFTGTVEDQSVLYRMHLLFWEVRIRCNWRIRYSSY